MRDAFRQRIPATSEKKETRVLEARALFDMYKRISGSGNNVLGAKDLMLLGEAFRGNEAFAEDRAWVRDQLVSLLDDLPAETQIDIINHLADDDPELVARVLDAGSAKIKDGYERTRNAAKSKNASRDTHDAATRMEAALGAIIGKVSTPENVEQYEMKLGYEHRLDETLQDSEYKDVKIRISHLLPPDLPAVDDTNVDDQWKKITKFLKQVSVPAEQLSRWSGDTIADRKQFLSEQANKALASAVGLINHIALKNPRVAGQRLLGLTQTASKLMGDLAWSRGWYGTTGRSVVLPLEGVEKPEVFASFLTERAKSEGDRKGKVRNQEDDDSERLMIDLEHQLALTAIERDISELTKDEIARICAKPGNLRISDVETVYAALTKRAETGEDYRPLLAQLQNTYDKVLRDALPHPHSKEDATLIEKRLTEFVDPSTDWEKAAALLETIKKSNAAKQHGNRTSYFPEQLIHACVRSLQNQPENVRASRLSLIEDFCKQPLAIERERYEERRRYSFYAETLDANGFGVEAARYAANKDVEPFIKKVLQKGDTASTDALWQTKGWDPARILDDFVNAARHEKEPDTRSIVDIADRFLNSFANIERRQSAAEDAEMIGRRLRALITRGIVHGKEYIPPLKPEEIAAVEERIRRYRDFSWDLWQQGVVPQSRDSRARVLQMLVDDGRDLAIAELGLGANQKVELLMAVGTVALERSDMDTVQQVIDNAKRLKAYGDSKEARELVSALEKNYEMHRLKTDIATMTPGRLRNLFEASAQNRDEVLAILIDSGKYHEAITICAGMGLEKIARQLIDKGAHEIAEELIKTAPSKAMPNRAQLLALVEYRKAGGEGAVEKPEDSRRILRESPALLRSRGVSEEDILNIVRRFAAADQQLLIDRCIETMGQDAFAKAAQTYEEPELRRLYLESLFNAGKKEEAIRFAILHNGEMLPLLVKRLAKDGAFSEIEPILYRISDLDSALEIAESLTNVGHAYLAQRFVTRFVRSLKNDSDIFKNVEVTDRQGYRNTRNQASKEEQVSSVEKLKRLIFTAGALESVDHLRMLFKDDNLTRFVYPMFEGLRDAGVPPREMARLMQLFGSDGIISYSKFLADHGNSKNMNLLIAALEINVPRTEAMRLAPHLYVAKISATAREAFVEDVRHLTPRERIQSFVDRYTPDDAKETILLASISLDKQEWNKFLASIPAAERDRVQLLADWYAAPRAEDQNLGPIIERATTRLVSAIEGNDYETIRLSLDTLLGVRTPEAASRLIRVFLKQLEKSGSTSVFMLANTLAGMESFKANTVLGEIMASEDTPKILSRYIVRLLVDNRHLDPDLRAYFEEKKIADGSSSGEILQGAVDRFRFLIQKYGINPDSAIMRYTDGRSNEEIAANLERMIDATRNFEETGQYEELGKQLMNDVNMRLLYFLQRGGRTRFSLINDYNFAKFTNVLQQGNELETHGEPLGTFENALRQALDPKAAERVLDRVRTGRFPLSNETIESVFSVTVDANTESQIEHARSLMAGTLGRNEFGAFARAMMYRSFNDTLPAERKMPELENLWETAGNDMGSLQSFLHYCEATFGSELDTLEIPVAIERMSSDELPLIGGLREDVPDMPMNKVELALTSLGKKLADTARKAAQQKKISKEERDTLIAGYQNPETVLATALRNELPPSFAPAIDEWKSHVQAGLQAIRETRGLQRGASQKRELTLRYLDKSASLPEYLRFADSATCCFTSKNFQGTGAQPYIARIWKDPLSFVFHVEEPSDNQTERRNSVGFVFGSYGVNRENEPVLILNGVYMDRKTDLAARKVMQVIEEKLAQPLGCKEILTASSHAGRSNYGAEFETTDREYLRLRALKQKWNNEPEKHTYDDIGLVALDVKEGNIQDTQVVNRWAKTGTHVLRKAVSQNTNPYPY